MAESGNQKFALQATTRRGARHRHQETLMDRATPDSSAPGRIEDGRDRRDQPRIAQRFEDRRAHTSLLQVDPEQDRQTLLHECARHLLRAEAWLDELLDHERERVAQTVALREVFDQGVGQAIEEAEGTGIPRGDGAAGQENVSCAIPGGQRDETIRKDSACILGRYRPGGSFEADGVPHATWWDDDVVRPEVHGSLTVDRNRPGARENVVDQDRVRHAVLRQLPSRLDFAVCKCLNLHGQGGEQIREEIT